VASNAPFQVSYTSISTVLRCSRAGFLYRIHRMRAKEQSASLKAGAAGHLAMARYFSSQGSAEEALSVFEKEYKDWAMKNVPPADVKSWENTSDCLKAWFQAQPYSTLPFEVGFESDIERTLIVPLNVSGERMELICVLDLTGVVRETRAVTFVDHKFTGWLGDAKTADWKMSGQFPLYAYALAQWYKMPVRNCFINAIEWSRLPGGPGVAATKKKCYKHGVDHKECRLLHAKSFVVQLKFSEWAMKESVEGMCLGAKKLKALADLGWGVERAYEVPTEGRFTGHCSWCEYKTFCVYGASDKAREMLLVPDERKAGLTAALETGEGED